MRWILYNNDYAITNDDMTKRHRERHSQRPWLAKRADVKVWRSFKTHAKALEFILSQVELNNNLKEEGIRE
jgi:hypothetical protein